MMTLALVVALVLALVLVLAIAPVSPPDRVTRPFALGRWDT